MPEGDHMQFRHQLPEALAARLRAVHGESPTTHDYHQAAVLLSELAESAWWLQRKNWQRVYGAFIERALDYLVQARKLTRDALQHEAIACDYALALTRQSRLEHARDSLGDARRLLVQAIEALDGFAQEPGNAAARHQAAIAHTFMARLAWGRYLGFGLTADLYQVSKSHAKATEYFAAEASHTPDGERAYRSHLMHMALASGLAGNFGARLHYARQAFQSAKQHNDIAHIRRAAGIWLMGRRGELIGRWVRDHKLAGVQL